MKTRLDRCSAGVGSHQWWDFKLKDGLGALTQTFADGLPEARKRLNAQVTAVTAVTKTDKGITS